MSIIQYMGLLSDMYNSCACAGNVWNFSPPPWVSDPDMLHNTRVTHVPSWTPGSLTSGFLWSRGRGKRFPAHVQRAFYVSDKRSMSRTTDICQPIIKSRPICPSPRHLGQLYIKIDPKQRLHYSVSRRQTTTCLMSSYFCWNPALGCTALEHDSFIFTKILQWHDHVSHANH